MKCDPLLPDYTGAYPAAAANTLLAMEQSHRLKHPLNAARIHLLLFALQRIYLKKHRKPLFLEQFIVLETPQHDGSVRLVPTLISLAAFWGEQPPCLIPNRTGHAVVFDPDPTTVVGTAMTEMLQECDHLNNAELCDYLKTISSSYGNAIRGMII